ncbi:hypothetical protein [Streptomyces sp. NPDC056785]|uniref:hypothetical protein n=1 Tax=Streptomyces sp. NPDC056785 TaxID=3345944 RepID=UPI0036A3806B
MTMERFVAGIHAAAARRNLLSGTDAARVRKRQRGVTSDVPATRWLTQPADAATTHHGGRRVGRTDLTELWHAADEARWWDSKFGGGNWKTSSVTECLRLRAAPLLSGA